MAEDFDVEAMLEAPYMKNVSSQRPDNSQLSFKLSPTGFVPTQGNYFAVQKQNEKKNRKTVTSYVCLYTSFPT